MVGASHGGIGMAVLKVVEVVKHHTRLHVKPEIDAGGRRRVKTNFTMQDADVVPMLKEPLEEGFRHKYGAMLPGRAAEGEIDLAASLLLLFLDNAGCLLRQRFEKGVEVEVTLNVLLHLGVFAC